MNLKFKEILIVAAVMITSFPILYFAMMLATGAARIEFGQPKEEQEKEKKIEQVRSTVRKDSLAAVNSKSFLALQQEREALEKERKRLYEQQQRIDMLERELENRKAEIEKDRKRLEDLVIKSDSLDKKKIQALAKVYMAMRPAEAAAILESLSDPLAVKIIASISDDRQKAKILSSMSKDKASRISRIMGEPR